MLNETWQLFRLKPFIFDISPLAEANGNVLILLLNLLPDFSFIS